jgi:hypothetical protein
MAAARDRATIAAIDRRRLPCLPPHPRRLLRRPRARPGPPGASPSSSSAASSRSPAPACSSGRAGHRPGSDPGDERDPSSSASPAKPISIATWAATAHDELREVRAGADRYRSRDGGALPVVPREAGIWVASAEGEGTQAVEWDARDGRWAVAVLNADGARAVAADVSVGAKLGVLPWIGGGLLLLGLIGVAVGAGLIGIAVRGQSAPTPAAAPEGTGEPVAPGTYPVAWTPSSTRGSAAGCGS